MDISEIMKDEYAICFDKYGATAEGCNWGGKEPELRQTIRYEKMMAVTEYKRETPASILDVGCGYGGLYNYMVKREYDIQYTGIDLCENMIEYAQKNDKAEFICGDFLKYEFNKKYSYVVCNGALTCRFCASIMEMDEYARRFIDKMFSLCTVGIVFNVMKSQVDFMKDSLYYKSPIELLGYCMTMTDSFVLDSSYPLYEYMVYLYKK